MLKKGLVLVVLSFNLLLQAQEKNYIGVDPFLPVFGTVQVQYERGITENMSLSMNVGLKTSSGIFKLRGLETNKITTDDFNFRGFKIIPEYRWYVQKQGFTGLYMGAYFKYQNYRVDIKGAYTDNTSQNSAIDLAGGI